MIRSLAFPLAPVLALGAVIALASPSIAASTGTVHFFLGGKFLDEEDWEPVHEQAEFAGGGTHFGVTLGWGWPAAR